MNYKKPITIFRGDDSDALGYQTIVGTIDTTLDLTGCKAIFRFLDFTQEFQTIPADKKLTITIPHTQSAKFAPGFGYAMLRITDANQKVRTFDNQIPVFVATRTDTPMGTNEFNVNWNVVPQLLQNDNFDMLSTDWELRQLVTKLAKYFGLTVINETLPEE